jgi:desulfoferrodoxin-like iron-binding protein
MENANIARREFLQTAAAAGAVALSAGIFGARAAENPQKVKKAIYVCQICGHVEFGTAPENCPICYASKEKFALNDALFSDAELKFKDAAAKHIPVVIAKKKSALITEEPSISVQTRIGKTLHPTLGEHHIRFIDCYIDDVYAGRMLLSLQNHPAAGFEIKTPGSTVRIVALCTLHSYWQAEATVS